MGRVSRYKRVKRTIQNFGLNGHDPKGNDPITYKNDTNLHEVDGFVLEPDSKSKLLKTRTHGKRREHRTSTKNTADDESMKKVRQMKISAGESLKSFSQRVDQEAREVLAKKAQALNRVAAKRKEYNRSRKKKQKLKKKERQLRRRKNRKEDEAELIYQGIKPIPEKPFKATKQQSDFPVRRVGVHLVAERPPEFSTYGRSNRRGFTKLKLLEGNT